MKKIALFIAVMLSVANMTAQRNVETVHLKNGGIVKGEIIEQIPNESLKVRTKDGNVFVYQMGEVEKITKEANSDTQATGHRGLDFNIDLGYNIATKGGGGSLAANLELGKRVNRNFYLGVGAGAYIPSGDGDITIPITANVKVYSPLNNTKIAPFLGLRAGYVINTANDIKYKIGNTTYTTEIPDAIMIEIMPGVQIPISNSVDFNLGIGYAHSIPTKGDGSGGAVAIRAGFGFHKGTTHKIPRHIPTRNKGFELTMEADGLNLWSIGADSHFISGGGNIVLGYKLNPNISFGVGYGCSYMDARAKTTETIYIGSYNYIEHDNGLKNEVVTNDNTSIISRNTNDGGNGYMHKFFVRGQYRLKNDRFSPIANIDLGFRKYSFPHEKDYYANLRGVTGRYGDEWDHEYTPNSSSLFISPSVGFSLRTTNNSYFEMRLGYTIAGKFDGKSADKEFVWGYGRSKELIVYEQKSLNTSGAFFTIGWTHTFGPRE